MTQSTRARPKDSAKIHQTLFPPLEGGVWGRDYSALVHCIRIRMYIHVRARLNSEVLP